MSQVKLLAMSMALEMGKYRLVDRYDMIEAARGELEGWDRMDVRPSDIDAFMKKVSKNWDIELKRHWNGDYIMYKPTKGPQYEYEMEKEEPNITPWTRGDTIVNKSFKTKLVKRW